MRELRRGILSGGRGAREARGERRRASHVGQADGRRPPRRGAKEFRAQQRA